MWGCPNYIGGWSQREQEYGAGMFIMLLRCVFHVVTHICRNHIAWFPIEISVRRGLYTSYFENGTNKRWSDNRWPLFDHATIFMTSQDHQSSRADQSYRYQRLGATRGMLKTNRPPKAWIRFSATNEWPVCRAKLSDTDFSCCCISVVAMICLWIELFSFKSFVRSKLMTGSKSGYLPYYEKPWLTNSRDDQRLRLPDWKNCLNARHSMGR